MADYIRRIVSGNKARFKDAHLNLELDLVYVTDQIIIMGFPAAGIEGFYRNRREDAKKFLDHRHGKNYWVFNFCPLKENSYPPETFHGRVSRYPFPDHHAPPLAIMALVAREMRIWLDGSPERVAVLHCKAGKGRSGTMACAYLLSCDTSASPPRLERNLSVEEWAKKRADDMMDVMPEDETSAKVHVPSPNIALDEDRHVPSAEPSEIAQTSNPNALEHVLNLHASRRMKTSSESGKVKQGVSIPSQRRFLYYWSLLLSHDAPSHLWATKSLVPSPDQDSSILSMPISETRSRPKVRLTEIKIRMKELSNVRTTLVRATNAVLDQTSVRKSGVASARTDSHSHVWVSLARYDDDFVETLERWERYTRMDSNMGQGHIGRRAPGTDHFGKEILKDLFNNGRWDRKKMVRSFARLGITGQEHIVKHESEEDGRIKSYTLHPLSDSSWKDMQEDLQESSDKSALKPEVIDIPASEVNSMYDLTQTVKEKGVVLDAGREVRVFMGWLWLIPTFHMPQPSPNSDSSQPQPASLTTKLVLTRKEVDFALGVGSSIIDVEISLEWLKETEVEAVQPPAQQSPTDNETSPDAETAGVAATLEAVTAGHLAAAVETQQAAEN
ncbi:hypothetical protein D9757_003807 [Collybiopsis confluens]|uniref:phosphatidylinositol-3,4,5-trisphosphate 3-phosphatase n=1 Tax=Collybiopsis confluens TaxID=2823264 RepID=A0A8H5HUW8_9AGAR|nr:hypothetical protein D9757_003807 [Collybiopsis confluens]